MNHQPNIILPATEFKGKFNGRSMATATPWIGLNVKSNATKSVSEIFLKDTEIGADARGFFSIFISASKNSDLKQKNMYESKNKNENKTKNKNENKIEK